MARNFGVFVFYMITYVYADSTEMAKLSPARLEENQEEKVTHDHQLDNRNLLMFMFLLSLTVLTAWGFKYRRFRFVHETGLAIMYGLIAGILVRFASSQSSTNVTIDVVVVDSNITYSSYPDDVKLTFEVKNDTKDYLYSYKGEVKDKNNEELSKAVFDPEIFFNVLLPPIIFHAGYSLKRRHFFRNFGAITAFAFIGTTVSCVVVGSIMYGFTRLMVMFSKHWTTWKMTDFGFKDCLFFGAIISATDPVTVLAIFHDLNVDVDLYAMVFGESVLNDAVAIVLANSIETYESSDFDAVAILKAVGTFIGTFVGSFALGTLVGAVTSLLTKFTKIREYPLLETTLFFLMSYISFLAAEASGVLTGIVTVLFCGISQAHYTFNNLSKESKIWTKQVFEFLNFLAENFVFLYIGISTFTFQTNKWDAAFIFSAFLAIIIGRLFNIYPLSFLLNLGRTNKIKNTFMHMMMFSGLRGAIAFALAIRNTSSASRQVIFTTTLTIVIATVILCGGLTTQMLQWLKIRVGVEDETEMQNFRPVGSVGQNRQQYNTMEASQATSVRPVVSSAHHVPGDGTEGTTVQLPEETLVPERAMLLLVWYKLDNNFVKPLLTNSRPTLIETLPAFCQGLGRILTTQEQLTSDDHTDGDSDTECIINENELSIGEHRDSDAATASNDMSNHSNGRSASKQALHDGDLGLGGFKLKDRNHDMLL